MWEIREKAEEVKEDREEKERKNVKMKPPGLEMS